ncbi:MAG: hypothetical protein U0736_18035 [Gemmataceae bacterium]
MLWLRAAVLVLCLSLLGAAYLQKPDEKVKPDDKPKVEEKAPAVVPGKVKGSLPANFKRLGLRDDQVQQIYRVRADYKEKADKLRQQIERLKAEEKAALEKILTAEQQKRLREIRMGDKPVER